MSVSWSGATYNAIEGSKISFKAIALAVKDDERMVVENVGCVADSGRSLRDDLVPPAK